MLGQLSRAPHVLAVVLMIAVAGCLSSELDTALDQASEDLRCDRSSIKVLDAEDSTNTDAVRIERYRFFACGQDVVYECGRFLIDNHRRFVCKRGGYRFPE